MQIVSVNRAMPTETVLAGRAFVTAIGKQPTTEPVTVGPLGLDGDGVGNPRHHGGPGQAVYVYGVPDYDWWAEELGESLAPGTFGENLTISEMSSGDLVIGDRLVIGGDVVLEVSAPRIPCGTLARRMLDRDFIDRFKASRRPGAYTRVVETGTLQVGDSVELAPYAGPPFTLLEHFDLFYDGDPAPELIERALAAPIDDRSRAQYSS